MKKCGRCGRRLYEDTKKQLRFRFMAMSKLIGVVAFLFVLSIVVYTMIEMHIKGDLSSLPQLIISSFGFAAIYSGFYLTMAKVEHIEIEKTKREKELEVLRQQCGDIDIHEEYELKKQELAELQQKYADILAQNDNTNIPQF